VEHVQLRFTIRCTSGGASAANFWSATFRLVLDGVPRAPDGYLNEVVAAGTSKEATVSFLIDEHPERVALRIDAARPTDVPVDLGAPR
jgi:hypothetical protein